jgi:hypothetical protein
MHPQALCSRALVQAPGGEGLLGGGVAGAPGGGGEVLSANPAGAAAPKTRLAFASAPPAREQPCSGALGTCSRARQHDRPAHPPTHSPTHPAPLRTPAAVTGLVPPTGAALRMATMRGWLVQLRNTSAFLAAAPGATPPTDQFRLYPLASRWRPWAGCLCLAAV